MRRKVLFLAELLLFSVLLGACLDAREVDEWAYIYSIGVDKGVSDILRITVQIPTLKGGNGGQSGGSSPSASDSEYAVISLDCPSFYSGVSLLNTSLSRKINYTHAKFFIVSEQLAREGIGYLARAFVRDRQIRRSMHLIVTRGEARDFILNFNPAVGTAISKTQEGMISMHKETGYFVDTSFGEFLDDTKSNKRQPVAMLAAINDFSGFIDEASAQPGFKSAGSYQAGELPRMGGNKTEYLGSALFDGGKMTGELSGDETRALLMIKGQFDKGTMAIPDPLVPELTDTLTLRQRKVPAIQVSFNRGEPVIGLQVYLEGDLQALQSDKNYEDPNLMPVMEKHVRAILLDQLEKTIKKCQKLECDVFGFGDTACRQFLTIQEWEAYGWLSHFGRASVDIRLDFEIQRTGTLIRTNPVNSAEGEGS